MDVAWLCPLPIGVVRWRSPGRSLTVVVKMSLSLAGPEVSLADPQLPLELERPLERGGPDELYAPSDFAPRKARCDVVLVGSARTDPPASIIQARVTFGELDRRFIALAGASSPSIPLREAYLRAGPDPALPPISVGAKRKRIDAPGAFPIIGASGAPARPLDPDFDFSVFNVAPPEQQVSVLRSGGVLTLEGLVAGRRVARFDMPSDRPRVYCPRLDAPRDRDGRAAPLREILLRCDTLWINVDRALSTLTWRGEIPIPEGANEPPLLVVTLAPFGLSESLSDIESKLATATRGKAIEIAEPEAGQLEAGQPEAVQTALPFRLPPELLNRSPLPFQSPEQGRASQNPPPPAASPGNSQEIIANTEELTTQTVGATRLVGPAGPVLPFHSPTPPSKR